MLKGYEITVNAFRFGRSVFQEILEKDRSPWNEQGLMLRAILFYMVPSMCRRGEVL